MFHIATIFVFIIIRNASCNNGEGDCYQIDANGENNSFCCDYYERKNGTCIECAVGYSSKHGLPCVPCYNLAYGFKCAERCSCTVEKCNHVKGCINEFSSYIDYPPREFSTEPNTQNPIPELSLKIVLCRASSSPSAQYRWTKDGTYITEYNALDYSHRMLSVNRTDAGIYRCIAKNYLGAIRSKGAKIVIAYIDNFESHTTQTVNVLSGDGVVINLPSINSVPDPAVSWYASGVKMAQEAQRHQVTLEKNLVLLSTGIHSYNGKMYKAVALNGINGVSRTTKEFALRVGDRGGEFTKPPALLVGPKNTTAEIGNRDTKLECIYSARITNKMVQKGSQRTEIVANNKYIFNTVYKRVLTIKDPDLSDAGQYECEAVFVSNGQSSTKTSDAYLTVNEAPLITSQIQSQYIRDFGQSIQVDCLAIGNPSPTITWYFNAQPVSSVGNIRLSVTQSGSLKIGNLEWSDAGVYQCFASNTAGETKISTWIKVDLSPPMFISLPLNLTLVEGADARFPCEVSGAPTPVIIWNKKVDSTESEVATGGRYQINPITNELLIITTETSDSALFSCNASNRQGSVYAEATLNVYQRTQITQPPLAFTELEIGSVASLQCGVSHDVNVNITWKWYQGVVELNPSARVTIEQNGTLTILGVYRGDNGVYKCQVLSAGGNDERSTNLKVIELPFKPVITNISVPPTALKSANISFTPGPNGNTPIERFIFQKRMVTYYPDKGVTMGKDEGWETYPQDVATNARFFVMPNLRPSRYFQFRLSCVNKVGQGPPSDAKPNTPLLMPGQPLVAAPIGFYGSPRSNSSIILNWQAPPSDTWNGDLIGHRVKYRLKGYTSPFLERNTNPWPSTSFELTGLIVFTEYEIKIAAYNNEDIGLYSDSINVRTREGVPGAPPTDVNVSFVNSTAIKIVWLPPDASKINGVNLGYIILAKGPGNIVKRLTVPPDPTDPFNFQQAFMHNLKKFTDYTITVTCYTGQGPGPASTPMHIKTGEDDVSNDENLYEYVYAFGGAVVFGMVLLGFYYKIKCYKSQNIIISHDSETNHISEVNEIENVYDEIDELALDDMIQQPHHNSSSIEDDSSNSSGTTKSGTTNDEGYLNPYQPIIQNTDTHTYSLTSAAVSPTDEEICNQAYVNVKQYEN